MTERALALALIAVVVIVILARLGSQVSNVLGCATNGLQGNISCAGINSAPSMTYDQVVMADSPLAYYRLNETSGTTAADFTGHGYTGTYEGAQGGRYPIDITLGVPGINGGSGDKAVKLNTSELYSNGLPNVAGGFSEEVWFKSPGAQGSIFKVIVSPGNLLAGCYVSDAQGDIYCADAGSTWHFTTSGHNYIDNAWHHALLSVDLTGKTATLYMDGIVAGSNSGLVGEPAPSPGGTTSFWLSDPINSPMYGATYDEAAYYAYPLTAAQASNHFQAGK